MKQKCSKFSILIIYFDSVWSHLSDLTGLYAITMTIILISIYFISWLQVAFAALQNVSTRNPLQRYVFKTDGRSITDHPWTLPEELPSPGKRIEQLQWYNRLHTGTLREQENKRKFSICMENCGKCKMQHSPDSKTTTAQLNLQEGGW